MAGHRWLWVVVLAASGCEIRLGDPPPPPGTTVRALTDAEISSVSLAVNDAEISTAQRVEARLSNPEVRGYALHMIDDHLAASERLAQQLVKLGIAPVENTVSQALKHLAEDTSVEQAPLQPPELDPSYVLSQLTMHANAHAVVDCVLMPNARIPEIADQLIQLRSELSRHLAEARQLRVELEVPDTGEGNVIPCSQVCAPSVVLRANLPTLPAVLQAAICR